MEINCILDYGYPYKEAYTLRYKTKIYPITFSTCLDGLRRIISIIKQQKIRRIYFLDSNTCMEFPSGIYEPYWNLRHQGP